MLKRILLSRSTVISLLLLMLAAVTLSYFIPQRFLLPAEEMAAWRADNPLLSPIVSACGLDHLYTSPWFAVLLLVFFLSMALSTLEQWRLARRRFREGGGAPADYMALAVDEERVVAELGRAGYAEAPGAAGERRFVRMSLGYWGNFLLHLGMLVVIASSVLMLLTQQWGSAVLLAGERLEPGAPWDSTETGLLAGKFTVPLGLAMEGVAAEFWETDDLKQLTTRFVVTDRVGTTARHELRINQSAHIAGFRVFQSRQFGAGFFVEFRESGGETHGNILHVAQPPRRDRASYANVRLDWSPWLFKLKYFADAGRQKIQGGEPLLVIRLTEGAKVLGEGELRPDGEAVIGPYRARLIRVAPWSGLIFARSVGIEGVFAGFAIIVAGGVLAFCLAPREVRLRRDGTVLHAGCRAARFGEFYREEFDSLLAGWQGKGAGTEERG